MIERLREMFQHHPRNRDPEVARLVKLTTAQTPTVAATVKAANAVATFIRDSAKQDQFFIGKARGK